MIKTCKGENCDEAPFFGGYCKYHTLAHFGCAGVFFALMFIVLFIMAVGGYTIVGWFVE